MNPLISVIIPSHYREVELRRAISSVTSQSYENFELLIVDDGKTLSQSVSSEIQRLARTRLLRQKHLGVAEARNYGIRASQGEILAFLDSDDFWLPEKLEKQIEFMKMHPEIAILQNREIWIRNGKRVNPAKKHVMKDGNLFSDSLRMCIISPSSVMLKREVLDECGVFDTNFTVCEDYDLWLRITAKYKVGLVDEALTVKHGGHHGQLSRALPAMDRFRLIALIKLLQSNLLEDWQMNNTYKEVQRKAEILKKGALKRGLNREAQTYSALVCINETYCRDKLERIYEALLKGLERPQSYQLTKHTL